MAWRRGCFPRRGGQVVGHVAGFQPHGHLGPQKQDVHAEEQPEHEDDQSRQAAVDGEVGEVLYKQGEEVGEQHPAPGAEGRPRQVVEEAHPPPGQEHVHQRKEEEQQQKPGQGLEVDEQSGEEGRGVAEQVVVDGGAEHQQGRGEEQHHREGHHVGHGDEPQVEVVAGLFDLVDLVEAFDDRHHARGGGPHRRDGRHRQHPGGLQGAGEEVAQVDGHRVGEDAQGHLDEGDAVGEVDLLHEGEEEGQKRQKRDDEEEGPVGGGGVQPVTGGVV